MPDAEGVQVTSYGARIELTRGTARLAYWPCRRPAGCGHGRGSVYRALLQLGGGAGAGHARSAGRDAAARADSHRPQSVRAQARGGAVACDRPDRPRGGSAAADRPAACVTVRIILAHFFVHAARAASGHPVAYPLALPVAIAVPRADRRTVPLPLPIAFAVPVAIAVPRADRRTVPVAPALAIPFAPALAMPVAVRYAGRLAMPLVLGLLALLAIPTPPRPRRRPSPPPGPRRWPLPRPVPWARRLPGWLARVRPGFALMPEGS
jgi:hypothetical protein